MITQTTQKHMHFANYNLYVCWLNVNQKYDIGLFLKDIITQILNVKKYCSQRLTMINFGFPSSRKTVMGKVTERGRKGWVMIP